MSREAFMRRAVLLILPVIFTAGIPPADYDVVIRNGTVYDGRGGRPFVADVAVVGDSIVAVGSVSGRGQTEINARGLAVAPGFINMLSWATESLIQDGRSQGDIRQGVTLEVFGEGWSMGPLNDSMRKEMVETQGDIRFPIPWTTLGDYLDHLVKLGVSPNVASFLGATTVRIHVLGYDDRPPTAAELDRMRSLVRQAMQDGALGVGSSLIYAPAAYAQTDELIALSEVAAEFGGMYISHIRNEGNRLMEAVNELISIASEADIRAEIYHLKASGRQNWAKMDSVIARVEEVNRRGRTITADMYTYPAGSTGLDATMPPWVQEGGHRAWVDRLRDPAIRTRVAREMAEDGEGFDNLYLNAGGASGILLIGFKTDSLKYLTGKTLAEVAARRGTSPEMTAMDLVIQDDSRVDCVFFLMSEDNIRKQMALPWVSFGSDGGSLAPEGVFLRSSTHPRAYGNFARLLGRYVRDEKVVPLEEAIRRLTALPAANLRIQRRGTLAIGQYADLAIFDPRTIRDNATFERPHQYATGMVHVFVNGVQVLRDGEHTGARPGRVVRGPGYLAGGASPN
jgi:N-acyl-D-amino-acid deacylase